VPPKQVFVGNGSDEVLAHAFLGLLKHDKPLLFPDITYSFYPVYCGLYDVAYETVPLTEAFEIRSGDYARPNGGIIFPNPNAPTGRALSLAAIERISPPIPIRWWWSMRPTSISAASTAIPLVAKYPNLLVVQTLSKSRSLAGCASASPSATRT
jgi:histidinol-phosphate aminotransferase